MASKSHPALSTPCPITPQFFQEPGHTCITIIALGVYDLPCLRGDGKPACDGPRWYRSSRPIHRWSELGVRARLVLFLWMLACGKWLEVGSLEQCYTGSESFVFEGRGHSLILHQLCEGASERWKGPQHTSHCVVMKRRICCLKQEKKMAPLGTPTARRLFLQTPAASLFICRLCCSLCRRTYCWSWTTANCASRATWEKPFLVSEHLDYHTQSLIIFSWS